MTERTHPWRNDSRVPAQALLHVSFKLEEQDIASSDSDTPGVS